MYVCRMSMGKEQETSQMETSMPRARNWPRNVSPTAFGKINLVNNLGYAMEVEVKTKSAPAPEPETKPVYR